MAAKKKAARPKTKAKAKTKPKPKAKPKAKAPSQEEMMAQWQAAMTPGAAHARLTPLVGTWNAKTTFVMSPGAPAQVSDGTSVHRLVLGGRYLEQHYRGTSMDMPFEGIGFTGYDNVQQRYVGTWMDSFGTGLMNSLGVGRPTDERIDTVSEAIDPSGKKVVFDTIVRIQNHEHHTFEMWTKGPDGKKYRVMLIEYKRG
jgi:uncharacterized protein DUF1579